jgi:OsmC subfamily peroxiredoxin
MAVRTGSARWTGDLRSGSGEVTVGEGAWTSAYSGASRFDGVLPGFEHRPGTNPEELLAAAHAACFTMALSLALTEAGLEPPRSLQTRASVHLRFVEDAPTIERIDLETEGDLPGVDEPTFQLSGRGSQARLHHLARARGGEADQPDRNAEQRNERPDGNDVIGLARRLRRRRSVLLQDGHVATRLPAQDLARARRFYAEKLGLEPVEERPGGLLYRCAGGEFALFESAGAASGSYTQMAWQVENLDEVVARLRPRGVVFEEFDLPGLTTQDGITEVAGNYPSKGGVGERAVWFKDSEGNLLAIGQSVRASETPGFRGWRSLRPCASPGSCAALRAQRRRRHPPPPRARS